MSDAADPPFDVREHSRNGTTVLAFQGDLDLVSAPEAAEALARAQAASATVLLDLRGLRFMDSSGLRIVLEAQRRAGEREARLQIAAGDGAIRRVLDLSGVSALVDLVDAPPEPA